jgi:hypothetical protein
MRLEHIAGIAFDHIFGRILRRALLAGVIAAFAVAAIYHFTVAGTLTLEAQYGALHAQLIVAAIYTASAAISYAILWAMRSRTASTNALSAPRETQLAMLVEAVMLGYALARKSERTR